MSTKIRNIPQSTSSDKVWITWYKALKSTFGKGKANELFAMNWDSKNGDNSSANTTELRTLLSENGMEISGGLFGESKDALLNVGDFIGDYFTIGKWLGIGLVSVVVVSVGAIVWQVATSSDFRKDVVRTGSAVATRGLTEI